MIQIDKNLIIYHSALKQKGSVTGENYQPDYRIIAPERLQSQRWHALLSHGSALNSPEGTFDQGVPFG